MNLRQPPALALRLLDRLGFSARNPALTGDLLEEFRSGRSTAWYWRQTLVLIRTQLFRDARTLHCYLKAVLAGWAVQASIAAVIQLFDLPARFRSEYWRWTSAVLLIVFAVVIQFIFRVARREPATTEVEVMRFLTREDTGNSRYRLALEVNVACCMVAYLFGYGIISLFSRYSPADLVISELLWLFCEVVTALLRFGRILRNDATGIQQTES
jgi:hypothetical protein